MIRDYEIHGDGQWIRLLGYVGIYNLGSEEKDIAGTERIFIFFCS